MSEVNGQPLARLNTTKGTITVRLFARQAPETVENFVGLAEGTKQWVDPTTGRPSTEPLYNGTIFHRVISGFMIQGGDPLGNGRGGPGYKFKDEFDSSLKFDRPYLLAMANAGPNTNGSQFFITVGTPDWLNNKHTIFGEVVSGTEVVDAIAGVKTNAQDRPVEDVVISSVEIERS
ncbi:peptidylprolyl isomerase [Streptomonospora nanhaiensis]|uniref:Peptidyl-prolyl cis-trans isomerase n=1 Tax=Streptomonospora nanhaiensis TaxID=1323731 RepID=A0A853BRQ1_9ACTN|nr:peptidylprolyl isomerase [Streptomonospora nanhaiensis]MBV2364287.1 peptidylprolyl isomerase [Streptomonospora nanhaiensis]MBX9390394.1 peptidylprolyl isomerase [Streptomonospora nanhaiensis]NYI97171.1 peptidyl-prolyl cis-trans isomerase A (cyclophilin A) [Streptomonospora nanhaiensis]